MAMYLSTGEFLRSYFSRRWLKIPDFLNRYFCVLVISYMSVDNYGNDGLNDILDLLGLNDILDLLYILLF